MVTESAYIRIFADCSTAINVYGQGGSLPLIGTHVNNRRRITIAIYQAWVLVMVAKCRYWGNIADLYCRGVVLQAIIASHIGCLAIGALIDK